jgi:hypothetical protein
MENFIERPTKFTQFLDCWCKLNVTCNIIWLYTNVSYLAYQPPLQWVPGLFLGVKRWGSGTDSPLPSGAKVKNEWSYTCTPRMCLHGMLWDDLYFYPLCCTSWTCRKTARGKVVPLHAIKAHKGNGGTDPLILNLGTIWRWMLSFTLRPLYHQYPLRRRPCTYRQCHYNIIW